MADSDGNDFIISFSSDTESDEEWRQIVEEQNIANVNPGLNRNQIIERLVVRTWLNKGKSKVGEPSNAKTSEDKEDCCKFCKKKYREGREVGLLDCGHFFHSRCIKRFLTQKNVCPTCRTTGLKERENDA